MATKPKWDQFSIKAEVHRKGLSLVGIARSVGIHEGACRQGLIGNSYAGAQAIADAIGIPFRELFPNSYSQVRPTKEKPSTAQADRKAS